MKILLTGANGQVGYELWRALQHFGEVIPTTTTGTEINGMPTIALDLSNPADIEKKTNAMQPDWICNAAAYTAVDDAENDPHLAFTVNADAPAILAKFSVINDAKLIHYSTDYVFSGTSTVPWKEEDTTNPQGVYAESKLAGEQAIIDSGCEHMIFRTAWVFSERGQNFLQAMLHLGRENNELNIVDDQIGSPTWATSIAVATALSLHNSDENGIFHMTSSGKTSWCGFARRIFAQAEKLGLIPMIPKINGIPTSQYPTPAQRPAYSVLECNKLKNTFNITMPNWQTALQLCIQNMRTNY
jgi:dTDP-4-dehydrorhamnose reductase